MVKLKPQVTNKGTGKIENARYFLEIRVLPGTPIVWFEKNSNSFPYYYTCLNIWLFCTAAGKLLRVGWLALIRQFNSYKPVLTECYKSQPLYWLIIPYYTVLIIPVVTGSNPEVKRKTDKLVQGRIISRSRSIDRYVYQSGSFSDFVLLTA